MSVRPYKTDILKFLRISIQEFVLKNPCVPPEHIYLPADIFDCVTDQLELEMLVMPFGAQIAESGVALRYWYMGVELHCWSSFDIVVTRDELP